jgi:hypothetical protein
MVREAHEGTRSLWRLRTSSQAQGTRVVPTQETAEGNLGAAEDREAARTAVGVAVVEAVVVEAMAEAVAVHRRIRLLVAAVTEAAVEAAHRLALRVAEGRAEKWVRLSGA